MERYTTGWKDTPLAWHQFMTYFSFPIGIIGGFVTLSGLTSNLGMLNGTQFAWVEPMDFIFEFFSVCLMITAFVGLLRKSWLGPRCAIATYAFIGGYNLLVAILSASLFMNPPYAAKALGKAITYCVAAVLISIYYRKRRLLFSPAPTRPANPSEPWEQPQPPAVNPSSGFYCSPLAPNPTPPAASPSDPPSNEVNSTEDTVSPTHPPRREYSPLDPPKKREHKAVPLWTILASGACICALLVITCMLAVNNASLNDQLTQMATENQTLEQQVEQMNTRIDTLSGSVDYLKKQRSILQGEITLQRQELDFWEALTVISSSYDSKYHSYGCTRLDDLPADTALYICSPAMAEGLLGFSPCAYCHPPKPYLNLYS